MKTIYQDKFVSLYFDETKGVFISKWLEASAYITIDEIKSEFKNAVELIEQYKPKYYLANNLDQKFGYDVDIQKWVATTILTPCIKVGVNKFAILMPADFIAQLSTEQTVDENTLPIEIQYFNDEKEAYEWFKN